MTSNYSNRGGSVKVLPEGQRQPDTSQGVRSGKVPEPNPAGSVRIRVETTVVSRDGRLVVVQKKQR